MSNNEILARLLALNLERATRQGKTPTREAPKDEDANDT